MATGNETSPGPWFTGPVLGPSGEPLVLKFTSAYSGSPRAGYPTRTTVHFKLLAPNINGHVTPDENEQFLSLERTLVTSAGEEACYVGFTTRPGWRSYLFYSRSMAWLGDWATSQREEVERRAVTFKVTDEADWATYQQLVALANEAMSDMQVLMKITELDPVMERPRRVDWTLLFPSQAQAGAALGDLNSSGSGITASLSVSTTNAVLSAHKVGVVDLGFILYHNQLLRSVAARHGGALDHWGATVEPKGPRRPPWT